jgi:hypothetical protein
MTYSSLKLIINEAYANFTYDVVARATMGANFKYPRRDIFFARTLYKSLMRQEGDETKDILTTEDIQNIITLFNKVTGSSVQIEYT